ncbi:ABC transporter substrate-binding protein [Dactylosporangium fulvum]|uniref:ABC transporter substrate-binding protein n=1 Tax=Dactylosporangium fulvum TaxID=53359 RepID=A0ABY5VTU5_9ACTN|nr:ABC transporter substrate-binding protein [Dactylosporangium fulvum]UWP80251.1 ABC transporter substrate-binding protein [Dactylosporangium fulvum]
MNFAYTGAVPPYAPEMLIANDPGMCAQYGVKPVLTILQTPVASPALVSGQVDMVVSAEFLQTAAKQPGSTTALGRIPTVPLHLYGGKEINSIAGLKGKTVGASTKGSLADLVLRQTFKDNGMTVGSDVEITYAGSSNALVGLAASGAIQAFIYNPPLPEVAAKAGVHEIAKLDGHPNVDPLGFSVFSVNTKFLQANRQAVSGMLRCVGDAINKVKSDPEAAGALLAKAASQTPEAATEQVKQNMQAYAILPFKPEEAKIIMSALESAGIYQFGTFDPATVIDNTLLTSS